MPTFKTTVLQGASKNVAGIAIPPQIVEQMAAGRKPPVKVTINGYTYRTTVAVMGGTYMVGIAAEHRKKSGVKGGDTLDVTLDLDTDPRRVEVPKDLAAALSKARAREAFDALAYSHRKEHVRAIEEAKAPETRARRIEKAIATVLAKK